MMKVKSKNLAHSFMSLALAVAMTLPVFAQGTTDGTIAGVAQDAQGAVVAGAKVTAKNNATGRVWTVTTADNGAFRINNVPVGIYTVTVEAESFKTYSNADVQVQLNRVTDFTSTLEPGAVSEVVTVTAGAAAELVEKTTSQLGKSFDDRKVVQLPIFQDVNQLALLSPNVTNQGTGVSGVGGSVGGNRARNNSFVLDGIDNNDISVTGPQITPIQDAVKEFTILTNQFSAEFGHSSAGQFNTITKSGDNVFHGDLWWYNINKHFRSLDHRFKEQIAAGAQPNRRPRDDFNRVGGDFGGPILRDKLFFFGAFQYQTRGQAGSSQTFGAPTAEGFSRLESIPGISPFTLNLLKTHVQPAAVADGSVNVRGTQVSTGQLLVLVPSFFTLYQWHANIDYNISDNDRLYGRVFYDRFRQPNLGTPGPEFTGSLAADNRLVSLTEIHNFNSNLINEFRFGYRRQVQDFTVPDEFSNFPGIIIDELALILGPETNSPQGGTTNVYQFVDTMNWVRGRHQTKFGVDFRNAISPQVFLPRGRGEYSYLTLEDFLLDIKPTGSNGGLRGVGSGSFAGNQWSIYGFFQEDFKWRPNLTVNLGVRYEYTSNARDAKLQELNSIANVDANDPLLAQIRQRTGLTGLFPEGIIFREPKTDKNNWAPRLGFAWSPEFQNGWLRRVLGDPGQSSIRGGFSLAYDVLFQNLVLLQLPPQFQQEVDASSGSGGPFGTNNNFLQNGGIPAGAVPPEFFTDRDLARAFTQGMIFDTQTPYTMSWSLSFQREFLRNWSMEARYLGTRGVHLFMQQRLNSGMPPSFNLPTFFNASEIPAAATLRNLPSQQDFLNARNRVLSDLGFLSNYTVFPAQGNSIYHGGSLSVKRRFARGFTLDASYTYSRTIDNITNELFSSFVNPRRPQSHFDLASERGESALSRPHRLVIGWIWELPFYRNERGLRGQLLGNWQISGVYQAESGQPVDALSFNDANGDFDNAGDRSVINLNGDPIRGTDVNWVLRNGRVVARGGANASEVVGYVAVDPTAQFVFADTGARANAGRNLLRSPGLNNWDLAFFKRFPINDRHRLEFRAELYNAFNHPQFIIDDAFALDYVNVRSNRFQDKRLFSGTPRFSDPNDDPVGATLNQSPRVIQLVLRYSF